MRKCILLCLLLFFQNFFLNAVVKSNVFKLPNGLTVILSPIENIEAGCVLAYHLTGVRDNSADSRGASYLYQYLIFLGTENLDPYDRIMFIKKYGGFSSGRVNYDNSVFYQVVPDDKMNNALWLENERIKSLQITDREVNIQKNNLYKRIYRLTKSNTSFRAKEWVRSTVFEGTVYESPLYGELEKIRAFNPSHIKNIYDRYKNLADIIMVISGHFNPSQVMQFINKNFSYSSPGSVKHQRNYTIADPRDKYIYKNWLIKDLPHHFVLYGFRTPAKLSYDHLYFEFIRYYLVDSRISKLEKMINRMNNLNVNISHEYSNNIESNALIIKLVSLSRVNIDKAKYVVGKELEALQKFPLSSTNFKIVKSLMEIDFLKKHENAGKTQYYAG
ncbi:MAG: insulinase family protein [Candidatus Aminicenantes bacterium]|nr:insulinase family protein [Candidatus Aminicenantes bacterium]